MKPAPFDYIRPESSDELCALLAEYGDEAAILAGGQSLMPQLNLRLRRPRVLLDLAGCNELDHVTAGVGEVVIGARVTQGRLEREPVVAESLTLVRQALPYIGNPQVRNRGTLCGSLAHAHPSAELPLCLLALGGSVELCSMQGTRRLAASEFLLGAFSTARRPDEFVRAATLPRDSHGFGYAFHEASVRSSGAAIIACAAVATPRLLRLAIAGATPRPSLHELPWPAPTELEPALRELARHCPAQDDGLASADYRRQLIWRIGIAVARRAQQAGSALLAQTQPSKGANA